MTSFDDEIVDLFHFLWSEPTTYVTMGREEIIIQVKLKDYNAKL